MTWPLFREHHEDDGFYLYAITLTSDLVIGRRYFDGRLSRYRVLTKNIYRRPEGDGTEVNLLCADLDADGHTVEIIYMAEDEVLVME